MARTTLLSPPFEQGFKTDFARDELPRGVAWRMEDILPSAGTLPRMRSGWGYASEDLSGYHAATRVTALGWHPFSDAKGVIDPKLAMLDENGDVFISDGTNQSSKTSWLATSSLTAGSAHPAVLHKDLLIFLSSNRATGAPVKVYKSGSAAATAALGGTPPAAQVGASWGDYLLLANGVFAATTFPKRIWLSDVGTPEVWTTAALASGSFWDMPEEIVALAPYKGGIFVWGYGNTWVLQGDIPPPGGNWTRKDFALGNGCLDARSVSRYKDYVIWANTSGVWKSDGSLPVNITESAGIASYWRALLDGFTTTDTGAGGWKPWIVSTGVLENNLFVTVRKGGTSPTWTTLMIDLDTYAVTLHKNMNFTGYATRIAGPGSSSESGDVELFAGHYDTPHAVRLSPIFDSPTDNNDADGTTLQPQIETPFFRMGTTGLKRLKRLYVNYALTDVSSLAALDVSFVTAPDPLAPYTALATELPTTDGGSGVTAMARKPLFIGRRALGFGFKLALNPGGSYSDMVFGALEAEGHSLDEAR